YLHHAVMNAFSELITKDSFPMYTLFIEINPEHVDINVHPTKQEIKFEDEKIIYAFVQSAVRHALAQFSVTPTLDFDLDPGIQQLEAVSQPVTPERREATGSQTLYQSFTRKNQAHFIDTKSDLKHWKDIYPEPAPQPAATNVNAYLLTGKNEVPPEWAEPVQFHKTYIGIQNESGILMIHQQNAHERILYERFRAAVSHQPIATQQSLFPVTLELSPADAVLLEELLPDLSSLGYQVSAFGKNTFIVQGVPADVVSGNEKKVLENLLEQYKHFSAELKFDRREKLFRSLALQQSIRAGVELSRKEMQTL